ACSGIAQPVQLIHFSTQLVVSPGYSPRDDEDFKPYSAYGASKAETERFLRREGGKLRWTIVRPATIWGPYHPSFGKGIWKYLDKRYYMLPAGSMSVRSYGYVANLVEQVMKIPFLPASVVDGQVFYLADGVMPG